MEKAYRISLRHYRARWIFHANTFHWHNDSLQPHASKCHAYTYHYSTMRYFSSEDKAPLWLPLAVIPSHWLAGNWHRVRRLIASPRLTLIGVYEMPISIAGARHATILRHTWRSNTRRAYSLIAPPAASEKYDNWCRARAGTAHQRQRLYQFHDRRSLRRATTSLYRGWWAWRYFTTFRPAIIDKNTAIIQKFYWRH